MRGWVVVGAFLVACAADATGADPDEQQATTHACLFFSLNGRLDSCLELNIGETNCVMPVSTSGASESLILVQRTRCPRHDPEVAGFCDQPLGGSSLARSFSYDVSEAGVAEARESCEAASQHWTSGSDDE